MNDSRNCRASESTPVFLLANLGAEVKRLTDALGKKNMDLSYAALERARNIFDELFRMPLRETERKEIELLQAVIEDLPKRKREFTVDAKSLESYFLPFAHKVLGI